MKYSAVRLSFVFYILFFLPLLLAKSEGPYAWYASFYQSLAHQKINKIRYFQIWVSPGANSPQEALPIGGSQLNFDLWLQTTQEFIESAQSHFNIWSGEFLYEITVDKNVYQKHQELFEFLKTKYGAVFHVSLIEDYQPPENSALAIPHQQCLSGVASVCSDYWRFAHAEVEKFDINVYVDIDTLSQGLRNKKQPSFQELGLNINQDGVYFPFFPSLELAFNIDMLVFKNVSALSWRYMRSVFEERARAQQIFFNNVLLQKDFLFIKNIEEYKDSLERRVSLLLSEPHNALNRYHVISDTVSGNFWFCMAQKGLAYPYWQSMADSVQSYYSWAAAGVKPSYEGTDVGLMEILYSKEEQQIIIKLLLMLYDKSYVKKHAVAWEENLNLLYRDECLKNKDFIDSLPYYFNILKINVDNRQS